MCCTDSDCGDVERGTGDTEDCPTFDDGPHPVYTEEMLKVLEQEQVPATFFLLEENAEQYGEQVRMIASRSS